MIHQPRLLRDPGLEVRAFAIANPVCLRE